MKHEISVIDAARLEPAELDRMFGEARALGFSIDRMRANLTAQLDQYLARLRADTLRTNPSALEHELPDVARVLARKQQMYARLSEREMDERRARRPA